VWFLDSVNPMKTETLLRLLVVEEGLETVEEWAGVLDDGVGLQEVEGVRGEEGGDGRAPLMKALDEVIPHLPEYSAVSLKLKALMSFCAETYSDQVNRLAQGWLQREVSSLPFRRWVLRDWLNCSHLTSAEPVEMLQWKHALLVAATNETNAALKRAILKLLNAVDETIEDRFTSAEDADVTPAIEEVSSIETVEALLDFCWLHAEQLASCSLLCAAKLHALAARTQRSAIELADDDEVLVRLRWSLLLKPMLFEPLLQHAMALKSVPSDVTASPLWTSDELAGLVVLVGAASRERMLAAMQTTRDELGGAFTSRVEHIHGASRETKGEEVAEAAVAGYVQALPVERRKQLLAELERDLDEAPPRLFPHVLLFFKLLLDAVLSSATPDDELAAQAIGILVALFDRRGHDSNSCMHALGLLLRLSVAALPIWAAKPSLYLQTAASLSETATLQVKPKVKWAARMALQQLLFECDEQLLRRHQSKLSQVLPQRSQRLVALRLGR
jgi:hypothetical protein